MGLNCGAGAEQARPDAAPKLKAIGASSAAAADKQNANAM